MKGETERLLELVLTQGLGRVWRERERHRTSVRFLVSPPLQDEPWRPSTQLPDGVEIENFGQQTYRPEIFREGTAGAFLFSGQRGTGRDIYVDVPRSCFLPTGEIDPNKAVVFLVRDRDTGELSGEVWIDESRM